MKDPLKISFQFSVFSGASSQLKAENFLELNNRLDPYCGAAVHYSSVVRLCQAALRKKAPDSKKDYSLLLLNTATYDNSVKLSHRIPATQSG
jgi:hypothetical protein